MFSFKQSIHLSELKYVEDEFEYFTRIESGKRIENRNSVKISNCENILSENDIRLNIDKNNLIYLQKTLRNIRNYLQKQNIKFSSFMKLHNEKVIIDEEKEDMRSYGLIRIVLEDEKRNIYWDDISIVNNNLIDLVQEINLYVKNNFEIIKSKKNKQNFLKLDSVPVVFSPRATGYLIHEIMGHTLEGDFYSFYREKYNDLKISEKLTVCDGVENEKFSPSINKFDDVGTKIKPLILVENQKICNIMATKPEDSFDGVLYGFARRESYKKEAMPRMRCTYIVPNENMGLKEISSSYDNAILMDKAYLGGVDINTGNYFVEGTGFTLRKGKKENIICDLKITGNIAKNLYSFEHIGNDFKLFGSYCMKIGHYVRVGCGGPTVSLNNVSVEGRAYEAK